MKDNIRIYGVKDSYIKYLSQYQEHLFLHEGGSAGRKYIGVVLEINHNSYFAPLSSFKSKHKKMKESVDLIKINAITLGKYGYIVKNNSLVSHMELGISHIESIISEIYIGPKSLIEINDVRLFLISQGILKNINDKSIKICKSDSTYR